MKHNENNVLFSLLNDFSSANHEGQLLQTIHLEATNESVPPPGSGPIVKGFESSAQASTVSHILLLGVATFLIALF